MENWKLQDQLEVSLYSCINNIHAVLPSMLEQKSGHIINIVDINGILATPGLGLMTTAVRALEGYSESLALTVFEKNIKVTVVETALEVSVGTNPMVLGTAEAEASGSGANGNSRQGEKKSTEDLARKYYSKSTLCGETKGVFSRISVFPKQPFRDAVHAVMEVAGTRNPPGRIAAGLVPSAQIREYLSAMSDDLDDFDPDAKNVAAY